jgi:hypothetical protein
MVSLVMSAALSALGKWWGPLFGSWETLLQITNFVVSFGLITVMFAMIYKIMPRVHIQWPDVWIGAGVTALMFTIGKLLIGLYIGKSGIASGFGAAASLVVVLVWVYYSAQIFLVGAEFTWVYAHELGSRRGQPRPRAGDALPAPEDKTAANPSPASAAAANASTSFDSSARAQKREADTRDPLATVAHAEIPARHTIRSQTSDLIRGNSPVEVPIARRAVEAVKRNPLLAVAAAATAAWLASEIWARRSALQRGLSRWRRLGIQWWNSSSL